MKFADVIAKKTIKEKLVKLVDSNDVPHAMLLTGHPGDSKLALALAFVSYFFCEQRDGNDSCGKCRSCIKSNKYVHPDIIFTFPFLGAKNNCDDYIAQFRQFMEHHLYRGSQYWNKMLEVNTQKPNINTRECHSVIEKLRLQAFESDKKIWVLWLPEYLGKDGNRLLKLIEEPPENTYILLVSDLPNNILPTILSRCQIIKNPYLGDDLIRLYLEEKMGKDLEEAKNICFIADGNLAKAVSIGQGEIEKLESEMLQWFRFCYACKADEILDWVEMYGKKSIEQQKHFFLYCLNFIKELLRIKRMDRKLIRLDEKEYDTAKKVASFLNFEQLEKISKLINDSIYYIDRNAHIRIMMTDLSISISKIMRPELVAKK